MAEWKSARCMRSKAMGLALLMLLSALGALASLSPEQAELDREQNPLSAPAVSWSMSDAPPIVDGWAPEMWQPGTKGAMWELDFSPNGELLAAVDLNDHRLHVWNISDGRTLLWIGHANTLVNVIFLSDDWVLAADSQNNWFAYQVADDGARPAEATQMRSGQWTGGMSGQYAGNLWGLALSDDGSKVAFCGYIDDPNIGGEVVVSDTAHFVAGAPANSGSLFVTSWPTDCDFSPNGTMLAATGRHWDSAQGFNRDVVYGIEIPTMSLFWTRNVAGSEASAWAIDWTPSGNEYTVGYTKATGTGGTEGVITSFIQVDGQVAWFNPIPQDVSSLEWMPGGAYLGVGLHDPGRLMLVDSAGQIQTDTGWHSTVIGGNGTPADVLAVAADAQDTRLATAGRDGTIEVWFVDTQLFQLRITNRFGTSLAREIAMHPVYDQYVVAESSGVSTLRSAIDGSIKTQCWHPDYGLYSANIPFAKSVSWGQADWAVGFSDGRVIGCDNQGKWLWQYDISQQHQFAVFGRVAMHPNGQYAAISWGENANNTTSDGKVAIIDFLAGTVMKDWSYSDVHWTLSFNDLGTRLASASQTGEVRLWNTSDISPANWVDDGVQYSHANYTGVVKWMGGVDVLITAGWDRQVKVYDVLGGQVISQTGLQGEAFGAAMLPQSGLLAVATGDAGTSLSGQIELFELNQTATRVASYTTVNIPRGLAKRATDDFLVVVNHTGSSMVIKQDRDGDGYSDNVDAFPDDPTQHADTDGDGWGDNSASPTGDGCPLVFGNSTEDRFGCPDSDSDGYSDPDAGWPAHPEGDADAYETDASQWHDSDNDTHGDNYAYTTGGDGLRTGESGDAFPNDATQWRDADGDGCGDNYSYDLDTGNRINENGDAFPSDASQCNDFDGDGYGDNYTYTISQGSGLRVENGDAFPLDNLAWSDLDGDGCPTASATGLSIDLYPGNPSYCDETAPFTLPDGLQLAGAGEQNDWRIWVNWSSASFGTSNIELHGQSVTDAAAAGLVSGETLDSLSPLQFWSSSADMAGPVADTWTISRGSDPQETVLVLRLTANSDLGTALEQWVNVTYVVPPLDDEGDPDPDPDPGTNGGDDDPPDTTGTGDDSQTESGPELPLATIAMVGVGIVLLLLAGLILTRGRGGGSHPGGGISGAGFAPPNLPPEPVQHPPCKDCGGFVQEMDHDGNRWTWCPSCRAWQDFLGKA